MKCTPYVHDSNASQEAGQRNDHTDGIAFFLNLSIWSPLQDLPSWAGAASQPRSTTESFWAAHGGVQPPPELHEEMASDWEYAQHVMAEADPPSFSDLSRPSPFSGTYMPPVEDVGSENGVSPRENDAIGDQHQWENGQAGSDAASAEGSAAGSGYLPILEGVQQAFSNMLRLPFVWGAGQEQAAGPSQPEVPVQLPPELAPQQEQENRAPNAAQGLPQGSRHETASPVPSPSPAKPCSASKEVEVNAVAQSADVNLCKVCCLTLGLHPVGLATVASVYCLSGIPIRR